METLGNGDTAIVSRYPLTLLSDFSHLRSGRTFGLDVFLPLIKCHLMFLQPNKRKSIFELYRPQLRSMTYLIPVFMKTVNIYNNSNVTCCLCNKMSDSK